jgi:alpha-beta hydrolase superfamily lysophospholipase
MHPLRPRRFGALLLKASAALAALVALVFTATMVAILWSDPVFATAPDVSPAALAAAGIDFSQPYPTIPRDLTLRDGVKLHAYVLEATGGPPRTAIVLVHGVLGSGFLLDRGAGMLREAFGAGSTEVLSIDLRGHGASGGTPGDVDFIGQYEEDLGDVVRVLKTERPGLRVVLAGHSMGGGIVLRYAERRSSRRDLPPVDGTLLFAPYLGWSSPTVRKTTADPAASAGAEILKVHLPRILGLALLNVSGITAFNGLRTEFFNLPPELPLRSYSYRAMESQAPSDYRRALAGATHPLLVVVGSRDEAFVADEFREVLREAGQAPPEIVPDATHDCVVHDPRAMAAVRAWRARAEL